MSESQSLSAFRRSKGLLPGLDTEDMMLEDVVGVACTDLDLPRSVASELTAEGLSSTGVMVIDFLVSISDPFGMMLGTSWSEYSMELKVALMPLSLSTIGDPTLSLVSSATLSTLMDTWGRVDCGGSGDVGRKVRNCDKVVGFQIKLCYAMPLVH